MLQQRQYGKGSLTIEEGYGTYTDKETIETKELQVTYLVKDMKLFQIGDDENNTLNSWEELQNKINEWKQKGEEAEQTVKLLRPFQTIDTNNSLEIPEGVKLILDLNGNTISSSIDSLITNKGKLTLTNSKNTSNVAAISSTSKNIILNQENGIAKLNNINIEISGNSHAITNEGEGEVEISENAVIKYISGNYMYLSILENKSTGTIKITGGEVNNESSNGDSTYVITNSGAGKIFIESGTITSVGYYCIQNTGEEGYIEISGGTITKSNSIRRINRK